MAILYDRLFTKPYILPFQILNFFFRVPHWLKKRDELVQEEPKVSNGQERSDDDDILDLGEVEVERETRERLVAKRKATNTENLKQNVDENADQNVAKNADKNVAKNADNNVAENVDENLDFLDDEEDLWIKRYKEKKAALAAER